MTTEEITKFIEKSPENSYVKISFKKRDSIYGLFVKGKDHIELSAKNFWRIVTKSHLDEYKKTKNMNLAKIFNGAEFSKLGTIDKP